MGGNLKGVRVAAVCSAKVAMVCWGESSVISKSSLWRPGMGSPLLLVTTTSSMTSRTLDWKVGADLSGAAVWEWRVRDARRSITSCRRRFAGRGNAKSKSKSFNTEDTEEHRGTGDFLVRLRGVGMAGIRERTTLNDNT